MLLESRFAGKKRRKYCESCSVDYKKNLNKLYQLRMYRKKRGKSVPNITTKSLLNRLKSPLTQTRLEEYAQKRASGLSYAEIAKEYNLTRQAIHKALLTFEQSKSQV